jgi:hypothetical protein
VHGPQLASVATAFQDWTVEPILSRSFFPPFARNGMASHAGHPRLESPLVAGYERPESTTGLLEYASHSLAPGAP